MVKRFCDLCGKEIFKLFSHRVTLQELKGNDWNTYNYEICDSCLKDFYRFTNTKKRKVRTN